MAAGGGVIMEILGFAITIGGWRLRLCFAVEDLDERMPAQARAPHHYTTKPFGTAART